MSCRWLCGRARPPVPPPEEAAAYVDLARAGRREDFRWLALSQGVPAEAVDDLWDRVLARCRRRAER